MPLRVPINPSLVRWACDRANVDRIALSRRFRHFDEWLSGTGRPTLRQLEEFAAATRTPVGVFFLDEPPVERLPIPDFRTLRNETIDQPSADLLDTIGLCQRRQEWYREHAIISGEDALTWVGSLSTEVDPVTAAETVRRTIGFDFAEQSSARTWEECQRWLVERIEDAGALVMVSGVVGNNTQRPLDPGEFRGFAIVDAHAPLIFVNAADAKAAQMFTIAHELAHLFLGETALSDASPAADLGTARGGSECRRVERWCNSVAAEVLVPSDRLRRDCERGFADLRTDLGGERLRELANRYRVSTLVMLRRLFDIGVLDRPTFESAWREVIGQIARARDARGSGGDYYRSAAMRAGRRFARAVLAAVGEGHESHVEAARLLGVKVSNFRGLAEAAGSNAGQE